MRIFFPSAASLLTDHLPNGEGLIANDLLSGLSARGHSVVACVREAAIAGEASFLTVELGRGSRFGTFEVLGYGRHVRSVAAHLHRQWDFDVAHWLFPQGREAMTNSVPAGLPTIVGPLFSSWPASNKHVRLTDLPYEVTRRYVRHSHRRLLGGAAKILLATPQAGEQVPSSLLNRTEVFPIGVDLSRFQVSELPLSPVVAFVGRLEPLKGIFELIDSFREVRSALPDVRLLIAGDGPAASEVRARVAHYGRSVELLGRVPAESVSELLRQASLLCVPAPGEPYGMALLEAMAAGRAVVAARSGGASFLVKVPEGGRLVPGGDSEALSKALVELLVDRDMLAQMGRVNRRRAEDSFAWPVILGRLECLYAEATGRAG
jgi:glycosyltransferase involved in cell wall biosynthesis